MDLNHLLYQHQVAVLRATQPGTAALGSVFDMARHYQTRIERLRRTLGTAQYPAWCETGPCPIGQGAGA